MATLSLNLAAAAPLAGTKSFSSPLQPISLLARIPLTSNWCCPLSMSAHLASSSLSRFQASASSQHDDSVFAAEESEEQRLKLDAQARNAMAAVAESDDPAMPGAWKWAIRKRVWDILESENLAQLPRPVHHRIPNFVGAGAAAAKVSNTDSIPMMNPVSSCFISSLVVDPTYIRGVRALNFCCRMRYFTISFQFGPHGILVAEMLLTA